MTRALAIVFGVGIVMLVLGGVARGFDVVTIVLIAAAAATAFLGVAIARLFASGTAGPAECRECGGLIAPSSPYCKHCGAPR